MILNNYEAVVKIPFVKYKVIISAKNKEHAETIILEKFNEQLKVSKENIEYIKWIKTPGILSFETIFEGEL